MNALSRLTLAIVGLAVLTAPARASEAALKEEMRKRFPTLQALKSQSKIGETYQGRAEPVKPAFLNGSVTVNGKTMTVKQLLSDENTARKAVYAIIAKRVKTKASVVAASAAKRNFARAKSGEWLLIKADTWQKKK